MPHDYSTLQTNRKRVFLRTSSVNSGGAILRSRLKARLLYSLTPKCWRVLSDDIDISHVLKCFAEGMTASEIEQDYPFKLRPDVLAEIFSLSAELIEKEASEKKMAS